MREILYTSKTNCSILLLMFTAYINCVPMPVDVIYTGDGCACSKTLGYQLNMPILPNSKMYAKASYGYRLEDPTPVQPKVMYRFDLTVEEPQKSRASKQKNKHLNAKLDRITTKNIDCIPSAPPIAPTIMDYTCGQNGAIQSQYRYVEQKALLNKCKSPQCNCHAKSETKKLASIYQKFLPTTSTLKLQTPELMYVLSYDNDKKIRSIPNANSKDISRRKREIQNVLFRKNIVYNSNERSPRYIKMYHKNLASINAQYSLFGFAPNSVAKQSTLSDSVELNRKTKNRFSLPFSRWTRHHLIKRDIKGEYDQLEHERENIDRVLPEIIQYMPETQHRNFKLDQCHFGCTGQLCTYKTEQESTVNRIDTTKDISPATGDVNNSDDKINTNSNNIGHGRARYEKNSTPIKRETVCLEYSGLPIFNLHDYQHIPGSTASNLCGTIPNDEYQFLLDYNPLHALLSTTSVPDPLKSSSKPLKFAGDLEAITQFFQQQQGNSKMSTNNDETFIDSARFTGLQYPVEHISNKELDRVIFDIIHKHPEFIDATSYYDGALTDPVSLQKEQTKIFLKKLIDRHFGFGQQEDFNFFPPAPTTFSLDSPALTNSPGAHSISTSNDNYDAESPFSFLSSLF